MLAFIFYFFINDKIIEQYKTDPHELYVVGSWIQNSNENQDFETEYKNAYSENPTAFSILGYENGLILKNILSNTKNGIHINALIDEVNQLNIVGPRGTIQFDQATNRTIFNHYIYKLNLDSLSNISFSKIETLVNDGHFIKAITSYNEPVNSSGWQNAYLCH